MTLTRCCSILILLLVFSGVKSQERNTNQVFLSGLDSIRTALKIPGMAVAVAQGDSVIIKNGFGFADLENHITTTPNTTFRVASITKTFTSTLIMQLVEQGKLNLDTPAPAFGIDLGNPKITVRNILTHTSEGEAGSFYQYNGYRFTFLQKVIEQTTGVPLHETLMETIVQPLGMSSTAPGVSIFNYYKYRQKRPDMMPFFDTTFTHLSRPYDVDKEGKIVESQYQDDYGSTGGLTTNVIDLISYSVAIDNNRFVNKQTQKIIFTPNKTINGQETPYGLGWFTQQFRGVDFYWHYGQSPGESGLFVKVPSMNLTMAVLANSIKLSSPFPMGDGDLFMSPVAQLFYKCFVNKESAISAIDFTDPIVEVQKEISSNYKREYKDFYNKEMIVQASIENIKRSTAKAKELYQLYKEINFSNSELPKRKAVLVAINQVGINQEISKSFVLKRTTKLTVLGVGENCSADFNSWCDYGWIEDAKGKIIWQMQSQPAIHAGGAIKNQKVESNITLPAGSYVLKYKSDWAHAYDNWDSLPPDNYTWGIMVFESK